MKHEPRTVELDTPPAKHEIMTVDVSIIVISYNTREYTLRCLESIYRETSSITFEVLVVDNASDDGSAEAIAAQFPQATLLASSQNHGFARANNLIAESATGKYLLLLNPDTEVLERAIEQLVEFARKQPDEIIAGGRTYFGDGTLNPFSCWGRPTLWSVFCMAAGLSKTFPRTRLFDPETLGPYARDHVRDVDIISGCFLLLERSTWERLEGFDPEFFMYGDDADLCLRAGASGVRCVLCPEAKIIHHGGVSEKIRSGKMLRLLRAKAQLFRKYWRPAAAAVGQQLLSAWCLTRVVAFGLAARIRPARYRASAQTWSEVWKGRRAWLVLDGTPLQPEASLAPKAKSDD